jgi:ethanolamine utilization protein EutN
VIGTVVPAVIYDDLGGVPMLWVQPLNKRGEAEDSPLICADSTRMAGPGETIYWVASREAALTLEPSFVPVDDAIVGIADDVQLDDLPADEPAPDDQAPDDQAPDGPALDDRRGAERRPHDAPAAGAARAARGKRPAGRGKGAGRKRGGKP